MAKKSTSAKPDITAAYIDHLLSHGKRPVTVYRFCRDLGIKESEFYQIAGSFAALENKIWAGRMEEAVTRVKNDSNYASFSAREKVLAIYFTLLEELNQHRSFFLLTGSFDKLPKSLPSSMRDFQKAFALFVEEVMSEGKASGEIATRPILDQQYPKLFSLHLQMLLQYWAKDESAGFEQTDAFIEKSVNLAFDLIAKGALDSALDLAKFLFKEKSMF